LDPIQWPFLSNLLFLACYQVYLELFLSCYKTHCHRPIRDLCRNIQLILSICANALRHWLSANIYLY
jgi:hypothetical protein